MSNFPMEENRKVKSPLTGAAGERSHWAPYAHIWQYVEDDTHWSVTNEIITSGFELGKAYSFGNVKLSEQETLKAILVARSKVWHSRRYLGKQILIISDAAYAHEEREDKLTAWRREYHVVTPGGLFSEASALSFEDKAFLTLENVGVEQTFVKDLVRIPVLFDEPPHGGVFSDRSSTLQHGMAYGCNALEEYLVYSWLHHEGYLGAKEHEGDYVVAWITPKGYALIERLRSGGESNVKRGFFVRRFDTTKDVFFKTILEQVEQATKCHIEPVWAEEHNDKIDDRILSKIRSASVLLVEVDAKNFNVGFEAGYALALRKPIVWIREVRNPKQERPFDIITYNCLDFNKDNPEDFLARLIARVVTGLDARMSG